MFPAGLPWRCTAAASQPYVGILLRRLSVSESHLSRRGRCGENDVDQDPSPLPKCFWSLLEEVGGHFVIAAGFAIRHSSNIAQKLTKRFNRVPDCFS